MSEDAWLTIYGAHWCPDCRRSRAFLGEHGVPYHWVDILDHPEVTADIEAKTGGQRVLPTIVFPDGEVMARPSNAELAQKLDLRIDLERKFWPLIVVGGGPAGLTASLFAMLDATETLVIERDLIGGNANLSGSLDNVPGFPDQITGIEFSNRLREQVETLGAEILQASDIASVTSEGNYHTVTTADGQEYRCNALVIATGSRYRQLSIPGEDEFNGKGVHFCSCDGPFYQGQHVAVVGGGNSAVEAALELAGVASKVTLVIREERLGAHSVTQDRLFELDNVSVLYHTTPREFSGRTRLRSMRIRNDESGEEEDLPVSGAFVFIGQMPNSGFLQDSNVLLDERGFIRTGDTLPRGDGGLGAYRSRPPSMLETSVAGIFAAGDVREGSTKLVAAAAGEGTVAAMLVRDYLRSDGFRDLASAAPVPTGAGEGE